MTLAIRSQPPSDHPDRQQRVGDAVAALAPRYADVMNACAFATELREQRMSRRRYVAFVSSMYPCVVGFNGALIRSIAKVDHVRQSSLVRMLAEQLEEEQAHNQMWREKLDIYSIDHEAIYDALGDYFERFSQPELEHMTAGVLAAMTRDGQNVAPGCFPGAIFPEPILAVCQHLSTSATHPSVNYWSHFASQSAIEMVIYDVVSTSVLPGLMGNPELDEGPASTQWWREHGRTDASPTAEQIDEERHLELSRVALNRSKEANALHGAVTSRAEDTLRLFAGALICQDVASDQFPVERFIKRPRRA